MPWKTHHPLAKNDRLSFALTKWTPIPDQLWHLIFPGIFHCVDKRNSRNQSIHFQHFCQTDGWAINCLFTVHQSHRRYHVNGFSTANYRHLIDPQNPKPLKVSQLTSERKPFQGATNNNTFHGRANFDYMVENLYLQRGPEAVKDALSHPWICLDTGQINVIAGSVVQGQLTFDSNGQPLGLEVQFTRFLFENKGRYTPVDDIIELQTQRIDEPFRPQILELAKNHGRTMDPTAYKKHCDLFNNVCEPMAAANRTKKALKNRQKLKVRC